MTRRLGGTMLVGVATGLVRASTLMGVDKRFRQLVQAALQAMVGDRVTGIVTERLMVAANRWPGLARFEDPEFADDLDRASKRVGPGGLVLLLVGAQLTVALVTGMSAVLLLARLHPLLPVALVAAMAPQAVRERLYHVRVSGLLYNQTA